jgi:DNA polymerase-1
MSREPQGNLFTIHRPETGWRPPVSLPELSRYKDLGFDTETDGTDVINDRAIGIGISTPDRKNFYLPWGHKGGGNLDKALVLRWAKRELRGKTLHGINCKFDNHMCLNDGIDLEAQGCQWSDLAFRAGLLNEHRYSGFNLDSLSKEYLPNGERKIYPSTVDAKDFHLAAAGEVAERCEYDAFLALRLAEETDPLIEKEELGKVLKLENDLIYAVTYMERQGAKIDVDKLERWRKEARKIVEESFMSIYKAVGFKVNPNSGPDMENLFNHLGLKFPVGAEGKGSFEAKFLKTIPHPIVQQALRMRKMDSLRSKYLDKYAKAIYPGDILRYNLHQLRGDEYGTVSGRFACANVNIQQVMKVERQIKELGEDFLIRELFIPERGKTWLSADADQIEFRLFAHYANSPKLNQAYAENPEIDFHQLVCNMIREVLAEFSRSRAKGINFGKLFGMGKDKMRRELNLDHSDEERRLCDTLFSAYDAEFPEAKRLLNAAARAAEQRGWVKTYLGRRSHFPTKERLHKALNSVIQGTAADVMKQKILELYQTRHDTEFTMRMTVHDEVDGDVPSPEHAKKVSEILNTQSFPFRVPILWSVDTGTDWAEYQKQKYWREHAA